MSDPTATAERHMRTRVELITSMRSEAARSDGQVGIVLAGAVTGLGIVITSTSTKGLPTVAQVCWWVGVASGIAGVLALGVSLCPTIPRRLTPPAAVWHAWHVVAAVEAGDLPGALDRTANDLAAADDQVGVVGRLVAGKWRWNRHGLRLLGAALLLLVAAGLVRHV